MQLFYEYSEEGGTKCLGLLNGKVKKFPENFCMLDGIMLKLNS